jgi:hypothetical protein
LKHLPVAPVFRGRVIIPFFMFFDISGYFDIRQKCLGFPYRGTQEWF